jgi:hypothetical protein
MGFVTGTEMDVAAIREKRKQHLPAYMLPTSIRCLPELPPSANGKIDRKAIVAALQASGRTRRAYRPALGQSWPQQQDEIGMTQPAEARDSGNLSFGNASSIFTSARLDSLAAITPVMIADQDSGINFADFGLDLEQIASADVTIDLFQDNRKAKGERQCSAEQPCESKCGLMRSEAMRSGRQHTSGVDYRVTQPGRALIPHSSLRGLLRSASGV